MYENVKARKGVEVRFLFLNNPNRVFFVMLSAFQFLFTTDWKGFWSRMRRVTTGSFVISLRILVRARFWSRFP